MNKRIISALSAISLCFAGFSTNTAIATDEMVKGDVNADGRFTIADVVLLKRWLLAVPDTQLENWKAADLCEDGRLDVFDLSLMLSEITEKYGFTTAGSKGTTSSSDPGTPSGVYTNLNVSYDEAKAAFGYPIEKCTSSDFLGYKIGIVSQNGNTASKEARCLDLTYEFTNGTIYIMDQSRTVGSLSHVETEQYDYLGRTFIEERCYDDEHIKLGYYPTEERAIAYVATFNKSVDVYKIMDLIISLEI